MTRSCDQILPLSTSGDFCAEFQQTYATIRDGADESHGLRAAIAFASTDATDVLQAGGIGALPIHREPPTRRATAAVRLRGYGGEVALRALQ